MATGTTPESTRGRRLSTLRRRADHLQQRIADNPGDTGMSWNRRELAALRWVLEELDPQPTSEGATS